ncbi:MAG: serpin family protein, partial [bacterium]
PEKAGTMDRDEKKTASDQTDSPTVSPELGVDKKALSPEPVTKLVQAEQKPGNKVVKTEETEALKTKEKTPAKQLIIQEEKPSKKPEINPADSTIVSEAQVKNTLSYENITETATVVTGNNKFALDIYAQLRNQEGNLFFSPYSISTALSMTYAGARGETETQMAKTLHFNLEQKRLHPAFAQLVRNLIAEKKGYQLNIANALWGQKGYGFLELFLQITSQNYGAGLHEIDFAGNTEDARKTINDWVEKQTQDKIKELLKPGVLDSLTRLVLTNAIYFKGNWVSQFKEEKTIIDAPFTLITSQKIKVPMMNQQEEFKYMEENGFQALEMPYIDNELSMVVLLPDKVDGLADLEKSLTMENLTTWLLKLRKQKIDAWLPRFKMTCEFSLADVLKSMGMSDAFALPPADFSGMTGKKDLFISAVIHKAFVEVNEEGTEAAAATAVGIGLTSARQIPVFRADHPFIFLIRDIRSGSILFMGRVMNPEG